MKYSFLHLEDDPLIESSSKDSIDRYNHDKSPDECVHVQFVRTIDDAKRELENGEYTGIIVDMKIDDDSAAGDEYIKSIMDKCCIPVVIYSALDGEEENIKRFIKSNVTYDDVLKYLADLERSGLYNIMSKKGILERELLDIFWKTLICRSDDWVEFCNEKNSKISEQMILRYSLAHLIDRLDSLENNEYFSEEVYLDYDIKSSFKTGCILKKKDEYFIILSPPCDLEEREGKKTKNILVCKILSWSEITLSTVSKERKNTIEKIVGNNYAEYYHWLPRCSEKQYGDFCGGVVDFCTAISNDRSIIMGEYSSCPIRVQDCFVKNILGRFAKYYSRQGQPDLDFKREIGILNLTLKKKSEL